MVQLDSAAIRRTFEALADVWRRDTAHLSSITHKVSHPAYRSIVALGKPALPFILSDLVRSTDHWFDALAEITGDDPVTMDDAGDLQLMSGAWLRHCESLAFYPYQDV